MPRDKHLAGDALGESLIPAIVLHEVRRSLHKAVEMQATAVTTFAARNETSKNLAKEVVDEWHWSFNAGCRVWAQDQ
jgi:hypothetical protein